MAKIERKYLAHFLEVSQGGYVRIGKDLEEYSPELGAQVEKTRNILGETSVNLVSYEKTGAVETYFAESGDPLFEKLQKILDESLTLDSCRCAMVEVKLWDGQGSAFPAAVRIFVSRGSCFPRFSASRAVHPLRSRKETRIQAANASMAR